MHAGAILQPSRYGDTPTQISRALIEEGRRHLLLHGPIDIRCPVRLLHGMADPDVPWQTSLRLAERLSGDDVTLTLIKDGDHRLSREQDLRRMLAAIEELSQGPGAG
jgi:pimeloyl-ACP methyl ester carboxylesterase